MDPLDTTHKYRAKVMWSKFVVQKLVNGKYEDIKLFKDHMMTYGGYKAHPPWTIESFKDLVNNSEYEKKIYYDSNCLIGFTENEAPETNRYVWIGDSIIELETVGYIDEFHFPIAMTSQKLEVNIEKL
jgi:hypothetical protein